MWHLRQVLLCAKHLNLMREVTIPYGSEYKKNDFKAKGSLISEKPAEQNSILKFPTSEVKLSDTS